MGDEAFWFDRTASANLLGVSARHFDEAVRPTLPTDAVRGGRKDLRFYAPAVVAAWVKLKGERAKPAPSDADPMLADADSPGLERYRNAKADLAEMERDRTRRQLFRVSDVEPRLMQLMGLLRTGGERLARLYGNDAAGVLIEAVDEWEQGVRSLLSDGEGDDGGDNGNGDGDEPAAAAVEGGQAPAAADDATVR